MRAVPLILAAGTALAPLAEGALVSFAQAEYTVVAGQSFPLDIVINFEQGDSASDLFSFGVRVIPEPGAPLALDAIEVAPDLNFFGVGGASAMIDPDPGILGSKGNIIDFQSPYTGLVLATYQVRLTTPGTYTADLTFFNTLGPTEQIFVGGNGSVLDSEIRFAPTTITVIPEPGTLTLVAMLSFGLAMHRTRPRATTPGD